MSLPLFPISRPIPPEGPLWGPWVEVEFFRQELQAGKRPEDLFYRLDASGWPPYVAYWPKNLSASRGGRRTIQSRNAPIGTFTETWLRRLLEPIAQEMGYHVTAHLLCPELNLDHDSPADLAFTRVWRGDRTEYPLSDIALIIEVKMSLVWNWGFDPKSGELLLLGDYTTHQGRPSLLRSDSVLKAIGKGVYVHTSSLQALQVPLIVIGNSPLAPSYHKKVDQLRHVGLIDVFLSITPQPLDPGHEHPTNIKSTPKGGFRRVDSLDELARILEELLQKDRAVFFGRLSYDVLGALITQAAQSASTHAERGRQFLKLLQEVHS